MGHVVREQYRRLQWSNHYQTIILTQANCPGEPRAHPRGRCHQFHHQAAVHLVMSVDQNRLRSSKFLHPCHGTPCQFGIALLATHLARYSLWRVIWTKRTLSLPTTLSTACLRSTRYTWMMSTINDTRSGHWLLKNMLLGHNFQKMPVPSSLRHPGSEGMLSVRQWPRHLNQT